MTGPRRLVTLLVLAGVLAAGCGNDSGDDAAADPDASASSSSSVADGPVGVVAIGHSGLTGVNSDPGRVDKDVLENSWATGTSPDVNSVYTRLVAERPETEGHVANAAENGAAAAALPDQARRALDEVPNPQLALILTIDNDIKCDGTDPDHVPVFGAHLSAALKVITEAAPDAAILIVSNIGRPATYAVAAAPELASATGGGGMCDVWSSGLVDAENVAVLTQIIETYEAEQVAVCATVPRCHTDGGALSTYVDSLDALGNDFQHLGVLGHARVAETIWPTVQQVLQLPPPTG